MFSKGEGGDDKNFVSMKTKSNIEWQSDELHHGKYNASAILLLIEFATHLYTIFQRTDMSVNVTVKMYYS